MPRTRPRTEYFSAAAQSRDHLSGHHTEITQGTLKTVDTTNNLFTFNTSEISSNTSEKLWPLADKHHYKFIFLSSYSRSRVLLDVCRLSRDVISHEDS